MKILFLDSPAFAKLDMLDAFTQCGIEYDLFFHPAYQERRNKDFQLAFFKAAEQNDYAFVFSFNFFPSLSNCCQHCNIRYVSYVYDSPLVSLYSCALINPCNYVFLFDQATYQLFKNEGISTVYYLPLAANAQRLSSLVVPDNIHKALYADVSFVGSLYNEEHNFYERFQNISDYTKGYLDGIMQAQQKIYGAFLLEKLLTPSILADMQQDIPYAPMSDGTESPAYVYANYFLSRKITANERLTLLKLASDQFHLKLYTNQPPAELPNAHYMGTVDYYDMMPLVFKSSNINLNITLKSIHSGIPLRCMDILGCGAFLLSNFQSDFLEFFNPNEDFVFYESEEDFCKKISYYLSHEKEREQICANGFGKLQDAHTFVHRVHTILDILAN